SCLPLSYQICEFLYEQNHLYDKILDCYLRDPLRKEEIFNYIHNLLSMPGYSSEEKHCVWEKALLHIAELVTLDPAKSADLVAMHFPEEVRPIITRLQVSRHGPLVCSSLVALFLWQQVTNLAAVMSHCGISPNRYGSWICILILCGYL
ncbi:unnamed protein product, partial [Oncorhynchus mykiss]